MFTVTPTPAKAGPPVSPTQRRETLTCGAAGVREGVEVREEALQQVGERARQSRQTAAEDQLVAGVDAQIAFVPAPVEAEDGVHVPGLHAHAHARAQG
jgi:hypothetical protein